MPFVVPCCHQSYLYILSSTVHIANKEIRKHKYVKWSLTRGKNNYWKIINLQAQKWLRLLTGGSRLQEVPSVSL